MNMIARFLERVNEESGKTENRFSLEILEKKLSHKKSSGGGSNQDVVSVCHIACIYSDMLLIFQLYRII